jgi:hypothetical protein
MTTTQIIRSVMKIKPSEVKPGMRIRCKYLGDGSSFYTVATAKVEPWSSGRDDLIITLDPPLMNRYGKPEWVFSLNTRIDIA